MSIKLMIAAWEVPPAVMAMGRKFALVALCDQANDQGECYPSVEHLANKCSMSVRAMRGHLHDLEVSGALSRTFREGRSTLYRLHPGRFCLPLEVKTTPADSAYTPADSAYTPADSAYTPADSAYTPADSAPITITKPLLNHHLPTDPAPASVPTEKSAVVVGGGDFEKVEVEEKELPWPDSLGTAERHRGAVILCGLSHVDATACVQLLEVALKAGGISSPMGYLAGLAKRARASTLDCSPLQAADAVAQRDSAAVTLKVETSNRDAELAWLRTVASAAGMTLVEAAEAMARHLLPYLPKNEQNINQSV